MSLPLPPEHSFRTLAIGLLHDHIRKEAGKQAAKLGPDNIPGETDRAKARRISETVTKTLELLDYRRCIGWLEALPQGECPDVRSAVEEVTGIIEGGKDPRTTIFLMLAEFTTLLSPEAQQEFAKATS